MNIKDAFVRGVRTAAQTFVGLAIIGPIASIGDVKGTATTFGYAAIGALAAGLVSFVNNIAEDNTSFQLPK
jgi:hypothetical protein